MLDLLQIYAINKFKEGLNLFITGKAGCGKSFLVKQIMEIDSKKNIIVTSTTGISSLNVNGKTFHSWAGITPETNLNNIDDFCNDINKNHKKWNKWLYTDILIIDEISMLNGELLDFVDKVAKKVRGNNNKFGGIQVIITGDFYQLPPVNKTESVFAFKAKCWDNLIDEIIILKKSYRQDEKNLIKFLSYIREGKINNYVKEQLELYSKNPNYDMKQYTHLFPYRNEVNKHNIEKLKELDGKLFKNKASSKINKKEVEYFPKDTTICQHLQLKVGALVIINKNINQDIGLVNGRQCIISSINGNDNNIDSMVLDLLDGNKHVLNKSIWTYNDYEIEQFPITLAWALTIHKAQGMGIEKLSVDIGLNIFNKGQVYVALSRSINSKYLHIKNYNISAIKVNSSVKKFYEKISKTNWYALKNESGRQFYQNSLTYETLWKLPKFGVIIQEESEEVSEKVSEKVSEEVSKIKNNIDKQLVCSVCNIYQCCNNYLHYYKEKVCLYCISKNDYYKQFNKTELKTQFLLSDTKLEKVLPNCYFKFEKSQYGYKSTKIYLLGQVINNISEQIDPSDYFTKSKNNSSKFIEKKELNECANTVIISNTKLEKRCSTGVKLNKKQSHEITMDLFKEGKTIEDIIKERNLKKSSIIAHLIKNMPNSLITWDKFMNELEFNEINNCFNLMGNDTTFSIIKKNINSKICYDKIRLVRNLNRLSQ